VSEAVNVLIDHARECYPDKRFATIGEMLTQINRISLASLKGQPNYYLRAGLAWVSQRYEQLTSRKPIIFLLLASLLGLSLLPSTSQGLSFLKFMPFPLLLNSLLVSILTNWAVRDVARQHGLGSLITSGRGMGAIFGLLFTLNLISILGLKEISQTTQILNTFVAMLAIVLFETAVGFVIILAVAWITKRFWMNYISGFYWSFVVIVMIWLLLTILGQPVGLIQPPSPC
jgi:hypothetical protein